MYDPRFGPRAYFFDVFGPDIPAAQHVHGGKRGPENVFVNHRAVYSEPSGRLWERNGTNWRERTINDDCHFIRLARLCL